MQIHVTEHKSVGRIRPGNCVRVFVDRDYHYGYFIDEQELCSKLSQEQRIHYLATDGEVKFEVPEVAAQAIINRGFGPYMKANLT